MLTTTNSSVSVPDLAAVIDLLRGALQRMLTPAAMRWLDAEFDRQRNDVDEGRLPIALGLVTRKLGRSDICLSASEVSAARQLRASWQPERWGIDEAARVVIVLATYRKDDQIFAARVDRLCANAELIELVAYLKGFAIFPGPAALHTRAREAMRASMRPPFDAIACHNPYPFDYFNEAAWNQMVVKCVFVGGSLDSIVGLQERRNPEVMQMLKDLVAERHAAGRPLPQEVHHYIAGAGRDYEL